ncbi:T9SS C-terminal target domain-containing protein [candidate division KSB1 bacterium]|nr:T9SS type A sorting domain-containing protein [candidate division KSB1 bacterium]RQW03253.1 MAG: T9SS C-terminal target domain-containing protein [candidate division KSB1 bacterium]
MKRLTLGMTYVILVLLSFALTGSLFAAMRYVNGQDGNDNWDGTAREHVEYTTIGPKETINGAIEVCSATGDSIEVHYADGFEYYKANPDTIPLNPALQKTKEITFASYGGVPTVRHWKIWADTWFIGPFKISSQLTLADGSLYGGDQLTMNNGTIVWRTLGQIASGQLNFAGICNFVYDAGTDVTTGLEMPPSSLTGVINNITTKKNGTSGLTTNLHLNEDKTMQGLLDLVDTNAIFDLEGYTLTLVGGPADIHQNRSDIIDGLMVFQLNNNTVTLNHNTRDLPNITTNTSGKLIINTSGKIGVLTANGSTNVDVVNAGSSGKPIGGLVNNSTGTVDLQKNGNIFFEFVDPGDFTDPATSMHWVRSYNGKILFSHSSGTPGTVTFGHLEVNGGEVEFVQSANNVVIKGNADFIKGVWDMPGNANTDPAARRLQLGGIVTRFGENGQNADFSSTAVATGVYAVNLWVKPIGTVTEQMINGNKPGSIWHGTMTVENTKGAAPAVKFRNGHFRVLDDVDFFKGQVGVDACILSIGNEIAPKGRGDFVNTSGFIGMNGGYVAMNGDGLQRVSGTGNFGSFAANNSSTLGVRIVGANNITSTEYFYLTNGIVDNDTTQTGRKNVRFYNPANPPKIVKLNGSFLQQPNWGSMVDVEYQGNEKDYTGNPYTDKTKTIWELPSANNGDPNGVKLRNLLIKTQNNTVCANGHGWVRLNDHVTVNGTLVIDLHQTLIINDSRVLTLNTGGVFDIKGYLFTVNNATIALGAPGGFDIKTDWYLPNIRIKAGSDNNKITAKGLRVQSISHPVQPFFCPDFDASLAVLVNGTPGSIIFDPNAVGQNSSLAVNFTDPQYDHIFDLTTDTGATFTLLNNLLQQNNIKHQKGATIQIGDYVYYCSGSMVDLWGSTVTESSERGLLILDGATNPTNFNVYQGSDPVIDANVEVNLATAGTVLALQQGVSTPSDSLAIKKNFTLRRGTIRLGVTSMPVHLALLGEYFHLYGNGSFDTTAPGILYLNATNAPMAWHIYNGPTAPSLNHLTVQNSVDLKEDNNQVIIKGNYVHQMGTVALGTNDLVIDPTATFRHIQGDYTADTGWLWYRSQVAGAFNVGTAAFNIPNLRINAGVNVIIVGNAIFTVQKRLDMYNGNHLNTTDFYFDHKGFLQVADGVVVRYHSGYFRANGTSSPPAYSGTIHLRTTNNISRDLPTSVWPTANTNLVQSLEVLTATNDPDPVFLPAPPNPNALNPTFIRLIGTYQVNGYLLLRNGRLVVQSGKTLTFADDLDITRVDGAIVLEQNGLVSSNGTGYSVTYANNGNWDIRWVNNNAPYAPLPVPPRPPSLANAPNHVPYLVAGVELPGTVKTLTFTRNQNLVNKFVVIGHPVTVVGNNTLNIRNNLSVQPNATMTVLGDVYFENESNVYPLATDPVCEFWSPLVFAGGQTPQMVYVPKAGMDIRPPVNTVLIPPPPGPAHIMLDKDTPTDIVHVTGGNLRVDHISFCNGLLDTDENNYIQIPAPAPGLGQGFDRDCMGPGNVSHVIGRITKKFMNAEIDAWSSNERQEFPVGSRDEYRPMAFTFRNEVGQVTIPHSLEMTAQHIDTPPMGGQGIPIVDNCGVTTNTYTPFFWFVQTNGTYTQEPFDLEVKAAGLFPDTNPADGINGYENVDELRILRRHGTINEIQNNWLLQGECDDYDNAQYTEGATVINEHSKGGLRQEGAIFTVGMPYGDLPVVKHFADKIVWEGNPYNAMTFYVTRAEFYNGKPLQPGDEIGIYDASACVGYVKLDKVVSRDNYAIVVCSKDDDPTDGITNGFTEGNKIYFRYWDSKTDTEYNVPDNFIEYYKVGVDEREYNVVFEQRSTRVELLRGEPRISGQEIWLTKGWNIFSLAVDPSPFIDLFDIATPSILGAGILNPIEPRLIKVQDEDGNTIEVILGNWQNNIGNWQDTEGYYVKVSEDVLLPIQSNTLVTTPTTMALKVGWNIISYPCLESAQDALDVLQALVNLGVLDKAMDQYGHALERLAFVTENNGWYNGIGTMHAGQGYYIKVNAAASLEIGCPGQDQLPKLMAKKEAAIPKHFARDLGNPYMPMNFYINEVRIDGQPLAIGDEIAAYDGDKMVGSVVVEHEFSKEKPLALIAGMDDGSGNGFTKGNSISFKVWKAGDNQQVDLSLDDISYLNKATGTASEAQTFQPRATATVTLDLKPDVAALPQAFELKQNYPNPFNPSTTITFAVPNEANVKVQVYDITGKLVTTLVDSKMAAGYHNLEWTGTDSNGRRVATGIYFYKMTAGNFVQTKKMLFAK